MITAYESTNLSTPNQIHSENLQLLEHSIWIDLIDPSEEEKTQIEQYLNLKIPTLAKMQEIEISSRLYSSGDTVFMTAMMVAHSESSDPKHDAVTFILTKNQLITVRYIEPQAIKLFISRLSKLTDTPLSPTILLIELLDATIDRVADILEIVSHHLDLYSKTIFQPHQKHNYKTLLQQLGINGDLNSRIAESLITFNLLITFFEQSLSTRIDKKAHLRLSTLSKDITALRDHTGFLSNKIGFLLDATLGLINIEQNTIIKIFSLAAVIFLPPTLIASIYGMNFHYIPGLAWEYGYFSSVILMFASSWGTYQYFKYKNWL